MAQDQTPHMPKQLNQDFQADPRREPAPAMRCVQLGGLPISCYTSDSLTRSLAESIGSGMVRALVFANANMIVNCHTDRARFADPRITVVNDGIAVDLAARHIASHRFAENLNGTDYSPYCLNNVKAYLGRPLRVFLYGASAVSNLGASKAIEHMGHIICGAIDGYQPITPHDLRTAIAEAKPDLVMVALGNPKQERWILDQIDQLPPALYFAIGALFDFLAGSVPRAPGWIRAAHLEWAHRLWNEPRRLLYRYSIGGLLFLKICLATR